MIGLLYVCATPIGNLEDITLRALRILKESDLIAAEDTRQTKILLNKYEIATPLTSYHKFNIKEKTDYLIETIKSGKSVALVSDAGTPGICDPGHELIKAAIENNITVVPIPGPSAIITALSISGISSDNFVFYGFIVKETIELIKNENRTAIFYEAPHRIIDTLKKLLEVLGDRNISICRELTKKFEEVYHGKISEVLSKVKAKGEFVIVVEGSSCQIPACLPARQVSSNIEVLANELIDHGISRKDAAKILSKHLEISKNKIYKSSLKK